MGATDTTVHDMLVHNIYCSGASVYNLYDEEDDDNAAALDKNDENDKMKEKIKLLRSKMENMTVTKKVHTSYKIILDPTSIGPKTK